uniref:CSON004347 protein n=1 Tax=Culicoides sonorensis TaxID=179676 RepID=A0A336LWW9_CULSO
MMFKHNRFKYPFFLNIIFNILLWPCFIMSAPKSPFSMLHKSEQSQDRNIVALRRVIADTSKVTNLTRQHNGDVFFSDDVNKCDTDTCVGLSSGTASLYLESSIKEIDMSIKPKEYECKCQCLPHIHTYREDQGICVDEIRGIKESVCEVIGSQYLTKNGWNELRNPSDTTVPFRLFRDEDSTFLQWLGESDLRFRMQGRLIIVHLACRDMDSFDLTGPEMQSVNERPSVVHSPNTFTPCVAFRIVGTPTKNANNIAEVLFASESQIDESHFMNLTTKEYIVIGISSLCLGLIYIASVFLYLHIKKKKALTNDGLQDRKDDYTYHQNDQVTFGAGISCGMFGGQTRSSLLNLSSMNGSQRRSSGNSIGGPLHTEEIGVIKSNPLLKHYPNLANTASDNSGFVSDNSNSNSEFDDDFSIEQDSNRQTSAMVHLARKLGDITSISSYSDNRGLKRNGNQDSLINSTQETECLPEEDVSITEDISHDDQVENMKALINGNSRRKLYFNPAYFEPHLLASPPPAAIEFLSKIREVISIAKYKMASKRFQPSLSEIPEEKAHKEIYQTTRQPPSRRESLISSRNGTQHKSICSGCSDCQSKSTDHYATNTSSCTNCGDKQKSIQKWLESVSTNHEIIQNEFSGNCMEGSENSIDKKSYVKKTANIETDKYDTIKPEIKPKPVNPQITKSISSKKSESSISNSDADTVKRVGSNNKIPNRTIRTPTNNFHNEDTLPKIISFCPKPNVTIPDEEELKFTKNENANSLYNKNDKNNIYSSFDKSEYFYNNPSSRTSSFRGSIKQVPSKEDVIYSIAKNKTKKGENEYAKKQENNLELYSRIDGGSEIYNNPVFDNNEINTALDNTMKHNKRCVYQKKNNVKQNSLPFDIINKMNQMPDMVYEAMASDYSRNMNQDSLKRISSPQLPTPDYTSHEEDNTYGTFKKIHHRLQRSMTQNSNDDHPLVPTPDYNTLGRRTPKKLYAPDSPIYSRKSPYSLIVDYETDSLERGAHAKERKSATPPSQSSETSQASPSLSSALPLEEELEIRNATYDRVEGFRKEADGKKTVPKIKYNTPFHGSMTIEVEHSPDEFDLSTDSDQFEPDTLDRKSRKNKAFFKGDIKPATYFGTEDSSQVMHSLQDMSRSSIRSVEKHRNILEDLNKVGFNNSIACEEHKPKPEFHKSVENIRGIYEEKSKVKPNEIFIKKDVSKQKPQPKPEGKILTLEYRHSKRQRQISAPIPIDKKIVPPDLIPCEMNKNTSKLSENKIQNFVKSMNSSTSHTSWAHKHDKSRTKCKYQTQVNSLEDTYDSNSVTSGSTNFTGVSDTQGNSEFESKGDVSTKNSSINKRDHKKKSLKNNDTDKSISLLEDYLSFPISNENFIDHVNRKLNAFKSDENKNNSNKSDQDFDKIEVVSTKTLSNNGSLNKNDENNRKSPKRSLQGYKDFDQAINNLPTTTKVFRAEINPSTNGMQIAMGLRDKAKKSIEIKTALKRFISIATAKIKGDKLHNNQELKRTIINEIIDNKDDGIGSLHDESAIITISKPFSSSLEKVKGSASSNVSRSNSSRMSSRETDGGYMSADSNELKTRENKRLYEKFNFSNRVNCISEEICSKLDGSESDEYEKPLNRIKLQIKDISVPIHTNTQAHKNGTVSKQNINMLSPPSRPPPPPPISKHNLNITQIHGKKMIEQLRDVINVNVYLSEEEETCGIEGYSNGGQNESSGESESEFGLDDICESGAESVETHSVFFKNIKNFYNSNNDINK